MLMLNCLLYALGIIILGVLVVNKDVTLMVLNNISFKWIFEKKFTDEVRKSETSLTLKEVKQIKENHLSRYIGIKLICLGSIMLLVVGICWGIADFQYVKEVGTKVYMDAPNMARILVILEAISTGIFTLVMIYKATNWSNKIYEQRIVERYRDLL